MPRPVTEKKGFIPVAGTAQVEMYYTHFGEHCENVYHVFNNAVAPGNAATIADAINTAFKNWENTFMRSMRCRDTSYTGTVVRFLDAIDAPVFEFTPAAPIVGNGGTSAGMPGNVTAAVKWTTPRRGRSYRGRTYHIGMPIELVSQNQVIAGGLSGLKTAYSHLLTDLQTPTGYSLAVVSYASNKLWRDAGVATVITACTIDADLDSQRRRLHGRGK